MFGYLALLGQRARLVELVGITTPGQFALQI